MKNVILKRALDGKFVLIAEIGVNYYDIAKKYKITPMEAAKRMVREAKDSGIHAVKFQTYKADTIASKESPSYWDTTEEATRSQYELFKKFDSFGKKEYQELSDYCEELGIEFCSTPFDVESADYLDPMMNLYKISSSDLTNIPFIRYIAEKGKPVILSTGASNADEIDRAVDTIRRFNHQPLILLHCVLEYPTPYEHACLNKIVGLKSRYPDVIVGYSDHTKPDPHCDIIKTAYLLGANVIEKHFTLDKTLKGNDHYHAMDPSDAANILSSIEFLNRIRGTYDLRALESERPARLNARRSLVAAKRIPTGTVIMEDLLTFKRPAFGISPAQIDEVIGKKAAVDIEKDTILQPNMLSPAPYVPDLQIR